MSNDKNKTRRGVLRTSVASVALGGVGISGAQESDSSPNTDSESSVENESPADSGSIELTAETAGKKSDWEDRMETRRKESNFGALNEEVSTAVFSPEPDDNLEYVDHWKQDSETTGDFFYGDDTVTKGEHLCTIFEAIDDNGEPLTDSDGDYYYIAELYSQQEGTGTPFAYEPGSVERIENSIETNGSRSFEGRDPSSTSSVNGEWVTVKHSASAGSVSYGAEESVYVDNGTFGPDTWTPGEDGEYTIQWDGSDEGTVDVIAFVEITSEHSITNMNNVGLSWEWRVWDNF